tara:strand:+ start:1033 stop:1914 length:882 start_codon:yes stop_codon:yes gene_type:complete
MTTTQSKPATDFIKDTTIHVHNNGFVRLVDIMPGIIPGEAIDNGTLADYSICQSARVSYGDGTKKINTDVGLIRYLMRNRHTSPFEMIELKFHIKAPIFIVRQWLRHRTASVNEISGRYSIMKDEFFIPDKLNKQSTGNRQGRGEEITEEDDLNETFQKYLETTSSTSYSDYKTLIEGGVARETARIGLPLSLMSEFYWKIDLHNLYHFLSLRMDAHAQEEIRDFANAMFEIVSQICPISSQAFKDYRLNSVTLSGIEIDALKTKTKLNTENKRETQEFNDKLKILNLENYME